MFQKIINKGSILGGIVQNHSLYISLFQKYDPNIYINKQIEDITFNDFLYILDDFPDDIKAILRPIAILINAQVKPKDIIDLHNEKLYIPEQRGEVEKSKKLWEGWLLFLIYLVLHNYSINSTDYDINLASNIKAKLKLLYADKEKSFATTINHLLNSETFESRHITHYIFTNQNGKFNPNILTAKQLSNIVSDIGTHETITDQIVGKNKFSCLHIEELNQQISTLSSQQNLRNEIKDKIIEVLKNAI